MRDAAIVNFIKSQPWGIVPDALDTIANVVADHIAGLPVTLKHSDKPAAILGSLAYPNIKVIDIGGTLTKKLYGLDAISGGETMQDMQARIQEALDDPNISAIVLRIDSPGGTVDGTMEFANFIKAATKPIVTYADGLMASAAYWIGSAADKIVAFNTAQVGSIGVIIAHHDYSAKLEKEGIKVTHIFAGKYKAFGNSAEPLSKESKTLLQDKVDYFYTLFVDGVAANLGVDSQTVLRDMADGRIFIGQQAKDAGLVDEIGGLDTALRLAAELTTTEGEEMVKTLAEQMAEQTLKESLSAVAEAHGFELSDDQVAAFTPKVEPVVEVIDPKLQERLDALENRATVAEKALADKTETDDADAVHAQVISLLTPYDLHENEGLVALGEEIGEDSFDVVIGVVDSMHNKYKTLAAKLTVPTPDSHDKESKVIVPTSFDEAVKLIAERDKIDDEDAMDKATTEFPELFAKDFGGVE